MTASEEVRLVVEIEVTDVERFKRAAVACAEVSRTEPGTLVYDWYLDETTGMARLYEAYASPDALRAHMAGPVFIDVGLPLMECSRFVQVDAYGDFGDLRNETTFWPTRFWGPPFTSLEG